MNNELRKIVEQRLKNAKANALAVGTETVTGKMFTSKAELLESILDEYVALPIHVVVGQSENYKNIKKDTPLEIQVKVLEDIIVKQQAYIDKLEKQLKLYDVSKQSELACKHKFGGSYEQIGGGLTLHECEKCGIVQTCG